MALYKVTSALDNSLDAADLSDVNLVSKWIYYHFLTQRCIADILFLRVEQLRNTAASDGVGDTLKRLDNMRRRLRFVDTRLQHELHGRPRKSGRKGRVYLDEQITEGLE